MIERGGAIHAGLVSVARHSSALRLVVFLREVERLRRRAHPGEVDWLAVARRFPEWQASLRSGASSLVDERPWVTFGAIEYLEEILRRDMVVFEYGSGGSSLFFARRVAEGHTVEHDRGWSEQVRRTLVDRGLSRWHVELAEPEPSTSRSSSDPAQLDAYLALDGYPGQTFVAYASTIDRFPDEHFDVVSIDGRARPSCFKHAVPKVKRGGYLVLDNSDRPHYRRIHERMEALAWAKREFDGPGPYAFGFWRTAVWRRPE